MVETAEPAIVRISDYGFGDKAYALMKECNHKSLGNVVEVKVQLYLR